MTASRTPEPVLCYVSGDRAYFTTQPLEKQWGDDWNDAPYEHNAGRPYTWREGHDTEPRWDITQIAFEADLKQPCHEYHYNSPFSVQQINRLAVPWLKTCSDYPASGIWAGTPLGMFKRIIWALDGRIFVEEKP